MKKRYFGMMAIFLIAGVFSSFASGAPDGLERVAMNLDFFENESSLIESGLMSDYSVVGVESSFLATGLAGVIGVCITWGAMVLLFKLTRKKKDIRVNE